MNPLLAAIIPVGFIILIGFIANHFLEIRIQPLSQLMVYILAPALVINSLYNTTLSVKSATGLLLGFTLISLVLYCLVYIISRILFLPINTYKSLMATTLLPNNGNIGLPMIAFALGDAGLERAIIYMIGSSILLFGITPSLLRGKGFKDSIYLTLKLPLTWSIVIGLGLRFLSIEFPYNLDVAIEQLGKAAIPVALIILGMQLANTHFQVKRYEIFATFLRLGFAPFVAYLVGTSLGLQGLDLQVLILQSSMPAAVNSLVLVTEFGGDAPKVARTILVTTLSSFITLPILIKLSDALM